MKVMVGSSGEVLSAHLPPVEQSALLMVCKNGQVKAIEKIETPVDEFGVPSPQAYLERLAETLDSAYEPPSATNVHHLVHPRRDYHQHGRDSVQYQYRESPSAMLAISMQVHNYGHWVMRPPVMPSVEIMRQRVKEQKQIDTLLHIGRAVIATPRWLDDMIDYGTTPYRTAEAYATLHEPTEAHFFDYLDVCEDGQVGLMPDRQDLADMGLHAATRYLGVLAAARALSFQRESRDIIRRTE